MEMLQMVKDFFKNGKKYLDYIMGLDFTELMINILEIIGLVFIRVKDNFFKPIIEEQVVDNELRINNSNISIDTLIKCNVLQLYKNNDINYIDFNFKALSYYVITILTAKLNTLKTKQLVSKLYELNENRRCKEANSN